MPTALEKGRRQRNRISAFYAIGWNFIIRVLMGLVFYFSVRIILSGLVMTFGDCSFELSKMPVDVAQLLISALLLIAALWWEGNRLHYAASLWMTALLFISLAQWASFFLLLSKGQNTEALLGILPFVLFTTIFVLIWLFLPVNKRLRIAATVIALILSAFWISDLPKSLEAAGSLHSVLKNYGDFNRQLRELHTVPAADLQLNVGDSRIRQDWIYIAVNPEDYRIDPEFSTLRKLEYVSKITISLPGMYREFLQAELDLNFANLEKAGIYYFYKYAAGYKIVLRDFRYSGDALFRAEDQRGEIYYLDNVIVRRK